MTNDTTFLAQLSDLHIRAPGQRAYGRIDTAAYLRTAVQSVLHLRQQPDAVVITGDLTDFGRVAEYEHLAALLLPLTMPVYLMPGNHDDRDALRSAFPHHAYLGAQGFIQYEAQIGALRLIALDTLDAGQSAGRLCPQRLAWLAEALERNRHQPVIVALHHPPFQTLIGHMDAIGLRAGSEELEALVALYPNVERLICGHLHRTIHARFAHTIVSTAPSPAHQVTLDLSPQADSTWMLEPPGFHLHALPAHGRLVSHVASCAQAEGPFPFHEDNGALID